MTAHDPAIHRLEREIWAAGYWLDQQIRDGSYYAAAIDEADTGLDNPPIVAEALEATQLEALSVLTLRLGIPA